MFGTLTLVVVAGLLGPALAAGRSGRIPVVVGQIAGGVLIGRTGLHLVDPAAQPLPAFHDLGFAMLMLSAGTHIDLRDPGLRRGLPRGALALAVTAVLAVAAGAGLAHALGVGRAPLLAVLLAGSSAAIAFPIIVERRLSGETVSLLMGWLAVADSTTVVVMPITLGGSVAVARALTGDLAIVAAGLALYAAARWAAAHPLTGRLQARSLSRGWALQLRLSLLLLLVLGTIAEKTGASTLVAGFVAGIALRQLREPERLEVQLSGVGNGFFVPAFFVLLGAELDLGAMLTDRRALLLAAGMGLLAVAAHLGGAFVAASRQRLALGLAASAQLGLPAAAASLGAQTHTLSPAIAAALVAGACLTLVPAVVGMNRLAAALVAPSPG
ncbi:MAG TPA: cation:proton antiporter [Candidatus Dormibacteraeota bacterium]|nr:cation:proton antiporter [Candidatus Dormibacteraeota bacterium]